MDEGWTRQKYLTIGAKISYNWGKNILQLGQEYFTILARISYNKSTIILRRKQRYFTALQPKTLTMEAKNFFHCSKKIRSNIDLMILGNYESSSSSQPVRTLISRFPFFGEFLPAGEIWTNTSQSTKSTLNKKKCGESVFLSKSWKNIQKVLKCSEFIF